MLLVCLALALSSALAACGDDEKESGSSGSGTAASESSGNPEVEAAKAKVEEAKKPTTEIGQTEPLKQKPEPGKTIVWLDCDFEQCTQTGEAMREAVKAIGWKVKFINYKSADPATLVSAFKQALQSKPAGVALSGVPKAVWGQQVDPLYKKAGVPVAQGLAGDQPTDDVLIANLFNKDDLAVDAEMLANWMTADSGGKGKAVVLGVPDFPILGGFPGDFKKSLSAACKACAAEVVEATIQQIGTPEGGNQLLVSAMQRDPEIDYAITSDGHLNPGLPAALQGAGLTGKKIGGALASEENLQQVLAGKETAFTGQHISYYGWLLVDAILRHDQGMEIPPGNGGMPHQLLMKDNIEEPSRDLKEPSTYQEDFKKLWNPAG